VAAHDGTVRLWDVETGAALAVLGGHSQFVTDVSFSDDGALLASVGAVGAVILWNVTDHSRMRQSASADTLRGAVLLPGRPHALHRAPELREVSEPMRDHAGRRDLVPSPDGRSVIATDGLQRLEPDPATGPHVQWMFAQRLAGRSIAGIARELTERGVPCPSEVDPQRNRHRDGGAWTLRTVAVILSNPRYTGRQVWGRQQQAARRSAGLSDQSMSAGEWAVSVRPAHPALVSEAEFVAAQHVRAARQTGDGRARSYLLSGLVRCGVCGRRMDSHWVHGRAGYRCRHGHSSSRPRADGPRYVYVGEDLLVRELVGRLADRLAVPKVDQVRRSDVASTLATLRAERLLVVHDGRSWELTTRQ
jgi:Recombinase/Recombinase zinc beta ribbon domain/WD domain, G-beta repeat